ncbi:MAG: hypothetical protein R2800_00570 [Flavipsychrobacter sp.]
MKLIRILIYTVLFFAGFIAWDYYKVPADIEPTNKHIPLRNDNLKGLLYLPSPDNKKNLTLTSSYDSGKYINTGALVMWAQGGGSIFYYEKEDAKIVAEWVNKDTLKIQHDTSLIFTKKDYWLKFYRDTVIVIYNTF